MGRGTQTSQMHRTLCHSWKNEIGNSKHYFQIFKTNVELVGYKIS